MAHELSPLIAGEYLEPEELVRRLRVEFGFVDAEAGTGREMTAELQWPFLLIRPMAL